MVRLGSLQKFESNLWFQTAPNLFGGIPLKVRKLAFGLGCACLYRTSCGECHIRGRHPRYFRKSERPEGGQEVTSQRI